MKGEDDIRQDAIMQQVFTSVNDFLRRRVTHEEGLKSTANEQSELKITTYNIIPLSPESGVLEWVNDALLFGDYLLDKSKNTIVAHSKYYPA